MAELEKQTAVKRKEDSRVETMHEMERQLANLTQLSENYSKQVEAQKKQIENLQAANA